MHRVSVIICVYNRAGQVISCLESLLRLDYENVEIVVVDDGSTDHTPARLESFRDDHPEADIRIVRNPRNLGVSGARNAGLAAATGEFAAFTDSDCTVDRGWLRELIAVFDSARVVAASGTVFDAPPRTWAERAYVGTCRVGLEGVQQRPLIGNNMCFRRKLATEFGFEPSLAYGCDEDELAWRLLSMGFETRFAPAAIVHHDHAMTLGGYLGMASRQGQGSARYGYKRGAYLGRDLALLAAALVALLVALPLALIGGWWLTLSAVALSTVFLALQLAAMAYNEVAFKGKSLLEAITVLPAVLLYNMVKMWNVIKTLLRIATGREPALVSSKRRWREELRAAPTRRQEAQHERE